MPNEIINAKIKSTSLGQKDHGIASCWLYLSYSNGGQGFGGYALDQPIKDEDFNFLRREGHEFGMEFILQILDTLDVELWEDLPGTSIRVDKEPYGKIHGIGHYLEDKWFYPKELAKRFFDK